MADTGSILSRQEQFFSNLLSVKRSTSYEESEAYTAELDLTEPSLIKVKLAIEDLKNHKASGGDHIPSELIQAGGGKSYGEIHKLFVLIWNKKELSQKWKESIMFPIRKKKTIK